MEKLKLKKFVFDLHSNICEKVRILMHQVSHDVVQEALIDKEELAVGNRAGLLQV
jgi:hypothetical protein